METVKRIFREYVPPVLLRWWRERNGVRYAGNFPDWKSAEQMGSGYQAADILEKVADATRQVFMRHGIGFILSEKDGLCGNWNLNLNW